MRLSSDPEEESTLTHNRFYLDPRSTTFYLSRRITTSDVGTLEVRLNSVDGFDNFLLHSVDLAAGTDFGWVHESSPVNPAWTDRSYTLSLTLIGSGTIDVDNISFEKPPPVPSLTWPALAACTALMGACGIRAMWGGSRSRPG